MEFLALIQQSGFENAELMAETGFNSSPKTKGVLVRARKAEKMASWNYEKKHQEARIEVKQEAGDNRNAGG